LASLRRGEGSPGLQRAWEEFGADAFDFVFLQQCKPWQLDALEQMYIARGAEYNRQDVADLSMTIDVDSMTVTYQSGEEARSGSYFYDDLLAMSEEELDQLAEDGPWELDEDDDDLDEEDDEEEEERAYDRASNEWDRRRRACDVRSAKAISEENLQALEQAFVEFVVFAEGNGVKLAKSCGRYWVEMGLAQPYLQLAAYYRVVERERDALEVAVRYRSLLEAEHLSPDERFEGDLSLVEKRLRKKIGKLVC
jgi:hypothetical protein